MTTTSLEATPLPSSVIVGSAEEILRSEFASGIYLIDPLIHKYFSFLPPEQVCALPKSGESIKSLESLEEVTHMLLKRGADRSSTLIGIGGGATTDFVGFLGSIFMRGVRTVLIPTTLLSQVDASIGGKNGVDVGTAKNVLGTIQDPHRVIIDTKQLQTLSIEEMRSGFAEVLKVAFVSDAPFLDWLQSHQQELDARDDSYLSPMVRKAISCKLDITQQDTHESGVRRLLNLGHTIGHAIEMEFNLRHGEAISIGMVLEAKIGAVLGLIDPTIAHQFSERLAAFQLPVSLNKEISGVLELLSRDKKREGEKLYLPLVTTIGNAKVFEVSFKEFVNAVRHVS